MNLPHIKTSIIDEIWTAPISIEVYRRRTEFIVVWTQVSVVAFLMTLYLISPTPQDAMNPILYMAILLTYFTWLVLLVVMTHLRKQSSLLLWMSIVADFTALFALIWAIHLHYGQPPGFYLKAPTGYYVFLFLALRVIRFEPQYVLGAGVMAILGWLVLAAYAYVLQGDLAVSGSFASYMTENKLLWGAEIDRIVVIAIVTIVLALTADRARVLLLRQIDIVADLEQKRQSLKKAALTDSFTGLPNRHAAPDVLSAVGKNASWPVGVMVIRIGDLGRTLTIFGSRFAEDIILTVRDKLISCTRPDDHLLRFDDDSFLFLVSGSTSTMNLSERATEIVDCFRAPMQIRDRRVPVRLRIGISVSIPGCHPDEALNCARTAAYNVTRDQVPPILFYDERMIHAAKQFIEIEHAMRHSLDNKCGFEPHYQPIVEIVSGKIVGFEALARWTLPSGETVCPAEFIPVAEATGMIVPLGRRIFQRASKALEGFNASRKPGDALFMSINVSIRQMQDPKFIGRIRDILAELNYPPELIKVELTESLSAQEGEDFSGKIQALRELGMKVAIDDFGTGYSSLSYLHSLPFTSLKIDQSFVRGLGVGNDRTALVKSIVDIAQAFNLESIAEGIEDEVSLRQLREMGVDLGQGYHFSRPLPYERAITLLDGTR